MDWLVGWLVMDANRYQGELPGVGHGYGYIHRDSTDFHHQVSNVCSSPCDLLWYTIQPVFGALPVNTSVFVVHELYQ